MLINDLKISDRVLTLIFILFQCIRLSTLILFSVYMGNCTVWLKSSSVDCSGFDLFANPVVWKLVWLCCSISTSLFCLSLLNTTFLSTLRPAKSVQVLMCLCRKPYFWSGNFQLAIVILHHSFTIWKEPDAKYVTISEIVITCSKVLTLSLIYQLNFTKPPERHCGFGVLAQLAYRITVVAFAADNLVLFWGETTQVAYKIYAIRGNQNRPFEATAIVFLMLRLINASFYHYFWNFFWCKLFYGKKDILTTRRENLRDVIKRIRRF